jgi:hypothetical protein
MHGFLPIFFLLVVLKIPVLGALWLVWWAAQEPKPDEEASPGTDDGHGRKPPFAPRPRGPHPAPLAPSLRRRGEEAGVHPEPRRPVAREAGNPAGREAHRPPSHAA